LIKLKNKQKFINNFITRSPFKQFERVGNNYKNGLQTSRVLSLLFQTKSKLLLSKITKIYDRFSKKSVMNSLFLNPLFMLKILLWKLNIFKSSFESAHNIDCGFVLVNGCKKSNNYILKKGDVISFDKKNVANLSSDFANLSLLFSFLEFDLYTGTFVVVKNIDSFSTDEYSLVSSEYLDVKTLIDYNSK